MKLSYPNFNQQTLKKISQVLKSGRVNYWTGNECKNFEKEFSQYHKVKYSVTVSNGSVALEIALKALNLKKKDSVIVTPRSFIISASCVLNLGLKPVFADVDKNGNLSIEGIKKAPSVWKASMLTMDKTQSLELIKKELFFCTNEYFYGKSRPYVQTFICQHPQYQWPLCFDLKHDPEPYFKMPLNELEAAMKKQPKFIRTVRHNKHPVIMNPSYGDKFDEYKLIGTTKLEARAKLIRDNKQFAEKIESIKRSEAEEKEQSKSQEDLYNEESIYAKFTTAEDNKIMPEFHSTSWDKKLQVISKFKDERLQYFGKKLLYMEKPESLSKSDYNLIHKDVAKKLLSTNNEKWNTIPRTYSEIDTLRAKFEKQGEPEKLKILDEINAYVEELEKHYSSA